MTGIEIDENSPAKSVTLGQTLLRSVVGLILVAHAVQKLTHIGQLIDALFARLASEDAHLLAYTVAGIELAAGIGLVVGCFTRPSAFVLVCSSTLAFAIEYLRQGGAAQPSFELTLVLASAGILFMFAGGGHVSMDTMLRERRRRKAIENDEIWSRPPYVVAHRATDTRQHA